MKITRMVMIATAILATVLVAATAAAASQSGCAPRADILERFAAQYDEVPVAAGITAAALLVEVLASADGASWTIIATSSDGVSCLIAAGEGWRSVVAEPRGPRT